MVRDRGVSTLCGVDTEMANGETTERNDRKVTGQYFVENKHLEFQSYAKVPMNNLWICPNSMGAVDPASKSSYYVSAQLETLYDATNPYSQPITQFCAPCEQEEDCSKALVVLIENLEF